MAYKLFKIAKELNVATSTIVEYLHSQGFDIDNKPTAKISDDMYDQLLVRFSNSMAEKEKAEALLAERRKRKEHEIKVREEIEAKREEAAKEKVVVVETVKEEPVLEKEEPKKEEPVQKEVVETTPIEEPVKEEPKVEPEVSKKEEVQKPTDTEVPSESEVKKEPETQEKPQLKVVGKIDLDKFKRKPKKTAKEPVQVKKQEPKKEQKVAKKSLIIKRPEPKKVEPVIKKTKSNGPPEEQLIRAETPILKGLKKLGKIDISKFQPKKKVVKPKNEGDKKAATKGSDNDIRKRRKRKRRKINPNQVLRNQRRDPRKKDNEVTEISEKEIEDKIKATMAKLKSGGGKSRRTKIRRESKAEKRIKNTLPEEVENNILEVSEFISVSELASIMDVPVTDIIMACMNLGVIVSINQRIEKDIIELVADEFNFVVNFISADEIDDDVDEEDDNEEDLVPRAPIVTVMGHVDHGKTSLLDFIRETNVAGGEAGGITQHVGAYEVDLGEGKKITFLDTPGHEAFTAMRARGAKVTDFVIIVIAADDKIMPQTKEAISHSQAAGVPMIFAINKIDKNGADPERIKQELASMNLLIEEWGGKYQSQDISAKTGKGIPELLEKVFLEAEILELKANPDRLAVGTVLEATLDKGKGYISNILVQSGTIKIGSTLVAGHFFGKIKAMFNAKGKKIKTAGPSQPVKVLGMNGAAQAGEKFKEYPNEKEAKEIATKRAIIAREQLNRTKKRVSLEEIGRRLQLDDFKELNLIVKADTDGTSEALADSLIKLSITELQVNVIHKSVGQISESDVLLAAASDAIIIGFQVRPSSNARRLAEKDGVEIKHYSIIYKAIDEVKLAMKGMLAPTEEEKITGLVDVRNIFKISKIGTIAGCYVQDGEINRNSMIRIIRNGIVIYPAKENQIVKLSSLKRFKNDVKEVKAGIECGLTIENFNDIKVGDQIESFKIIKVDKELE